MKTILFVHSSDEMYGSDRCLLAIVRGLPASRRAVVVLPADIPHPGPLSRELTIAGATVLHRRMLVLRRNELTPRAIPRLLVAFALGVWTLARVIRRERVTLVHSNTVAVICGAFAALVTRRPHLWHVHEFLGDEPIIFRVPLRLLLRFIPGAVVANSRATARAIGSRKTRVIHNAVFTTMTGSRNQSNPPTVGIVGRLSPRKGISEALHAAALLRSSGLDFRLVLHGGPPSSQPRLGAGYEELAASLGIDSFTCFAGECEDPSAAYEDIDILLVPSQRPEPFGLAIIEGMAAGCAVVVIHNGGGSDELLDDSVTGLYCGRDPASIASALQRLLLDSGLRSQLAHNAQNAVHERFSPDRYLAQFLQTYSELEA
ncbi:MAG: glycosyltransferase family 4 protein [Chloroflexia bacterium]|nr:glycosyltransferase family 4 protein [Chloroflexia bacterium]